MAANVYTGSNCWINYNATKQDEKANLTMTKTLFKTNKIDESPKKPYTSKHVAKSDRKRWVAPNKIHHGPQDRGQNHDICDSELILTPSKTSPLVVATHSLHFDSRNSYLCIGTFGGSFPRLSYLRSISLLVTARLVSTYRASSLNLFDVVSKTKNHMKVKSFGAVLAGLDEAESAVLTFSLALIKKPPRIVSHHVQSHRLS